MEGLRVVRVSMKSQQEKGDGDWSNDVNGIEVSADSYGKGGAIDGETETGVTMQQATKSPQPLGEGGTSTKCRSLSS